MRFKNLNFIRRIYGASKKRPNLNKNLQNDNQLLAPADRSLIEEGIFADCVMVSQTTKPSSSSTVMLFMGLDYLRVADVSNDSTNNVTCLAKLKRNSLPKFTGYVVLDSKLYVIGGDFIIDGGGLILDPQKNVPTYSREVWIYDLSNKDGVWERGPRLNGGKPKPLIVAVNGKIYVIAGTCGYHRPLDGLEILDPVFEVLDVQSGVWSKLSDPPFRYAYDYALFPEFLFHVVVGNVLYLGVNLPVYEGGDSNGVDRVFWFDLIREKWCDYDYDYTNFRSSYPVVVRNMSSFGWDCSGDVFDGKLYMLQTATKPAVFCVYDLRKVDFWSRDDNLSLELDESVHDAELDNFKFSCNLGEGNEGKEEKEAMQKAKEQDVNPAYKHRIGRCIPHLVTGLDKILTKLPSDGLTSWHLVPLDEKGCVFRLVCFFVSELSQNHFVLLSTFELEQTPTSLHARKVTYTTTSISDCWGLPILCWKIYK
ncbi:uncharacterized protein LOC8280820 isoform X2 [Ricinus communis]|uniref:uncharacterized protein LOC8280820 isoform X2 n=1 Tax=Ricinus communis TaxID=3988 RepID=UPI00201AC751|nr:uncharacterized protein LOC8280820 isoform X2 [Ricinus communis]